ncbi:MAG: hypothetical protein UT24_C0019G0012 [Candidatus Woesebacteria bacterium GW2011_GWB1_39_12]|uniref:Uncharacterized protein n=1 Tax=Candidatus Woesebacteria bacterium GW2011_GWB1_39_12 TaxID=1618574 RepID=A0A0G0M9P6_9BACT|nr:MAG: hypothetical protein UT24_C0019G0012 [Candidatus Woesebacteria bacterium GW2011_GWB1_39_12]
MNEYPFLSGGFARDIRFGRAEPREYNRAGVLPCSMNYLGYVFWSQHHGKGIEIKRQMKCRPNSLSVIDRETWQWNKKIPKSIWVVVESIRFITDEEKSFDSLQIMFSFTTAEEERFCVMQLRDFLDNCVV